MSATNGNTGVLSEHTRKEIDHWVTRFEVGTEHTRRMGFDPIGRDVDRPDQQPVRRRHVAVASNRKPRSTLTRNRVARSTPR